MERVCGLKVGGALHPIDILECAQWNYKKVGNPCFTC